MAKKQPAEKPADNKPENAFVDLMLVAADFVKSSGGMANAKKALAEAGDFIHKAGGAARATRALDVLESLKEKIGN